MGSLSIGGVCSAFDSKPECIGQTGHDAASCRVLSLGGECANGASSDARYVALSYSPTFMDWPIWR